MMCPVNTREEPCNLVPYVNFTLLKDVAKAYVQVIAKDVKSEMILIDQTFNFCTLAALPGMDLVIHFALEKIKKNTNFEFKCPCKAVSSFILIL
jgi:hypothetical protein